MSAPDSTPFLVQRIVEHQNLHMELLQFWQNIHWTKITLFIYRQNLLPKKGHKYTCLIQVITQFLLR